MEGALGERLKREYGLAFDGQVAMAALVYSAQGRRALAELWKGYRDIAFAHGLPFLATTPTRRANRERVAASRYNAGIIRDNVAFLRSVCREAEGEAYVGGLMGCRGDAYRADAVLSAGEAKEFHAWQAGLFREAGADFLMAGILPALPEAVGMAEAMAATGLPYLVSFMIRRDGRLIDGASIHDAVAAIDGAASPRPLCYMTNCVHPAVLLEALSHPFNRTPLVRERFRGIQANTSPLPPEALDGARDLWQADAAGLAADMARLRPVMDGKIFGGCCGTDTGHMEAVAAMISPVQPI